MERWIDRQIYRQIEIQIDRQNYRYIDRNNERWKDRQIDRQIAIQIDSNIERQIDRWKDGWIDRQIEIQIDRQRDGDEKESQIDQGYETMEKFYITNRETIASLNYKIQNTNTNPPSLLCN